MAMNSPEEAGPLPGIKTNLWKRKLTAAIVAVNLIVIVAAAVFVYYSPAHSWEPSIRDHDGDGYPDSIDDFPYDPAKWIDMAQFGELIAEMSPSGPITAEAGSVVQLSVSSTWLNTYANESTSADDWDNVTYRWTRDPTYLGSFSHIAVRCTTLTLAEMGTTGTVSCNISYGETWVVLDVNIAVNPPYLTSVTVTPSACILPAGEERVFSAAATNSVGSVVTDASFEWTVHGLTSDEYVLNSTTGPSVLFTLLIAAGPVLLTATCTVDGVTMSGTSYVNQW